LIDQTGISMIDEPVPTMPEMVPAIRPTNEDEEEGQK